MDYVDNCWVENLDYPGGRRTIMASFLTFWMYMLRLLHQLLLN